MSIEFPEKSILWTGEVPAKFARQFPDKAAIIFGGQTITYQMLDMAIDAFVESMHRAKIKPGQRIAYLGRNNDLYFVALFGCIRGGYVLVPINWRLSKVEIVYILTDSHTAMLIVDPDMALVAEAAGNTEEDRWQVIFTEPADGRDVALRDEVFRTRPDFVKSPPATEFADTVCLQLYTSGTTGKPKGVLITHRTLSIGRESEFLSSSWDDFIATDVILSPMPNFHAGGTTWMLMGLSRGCTCVLTADPSPANIIELCRDFSITRLWVPPTVIRTIVEKIKSEKLSIPSLQVIHYGGEAMSPSLLYSAIEVLGCDFGQFYGMTETGGAVVTYLAPSDHDLGSPWLLRSVGKPMPGMKVLIRDASGRDVPNGDRGEIWIGSEALMTGYWNRPEAERETLVAGMYRTGDGGYLDEKGYLFLTDRIKDIIISGGENIYPAEVEEVLRQWPGVTDAVVIGVPDDRWGEKAVAIVEVQGEGEFDKSGMVDFARNQLAAFKVPRHIIKTTTLPRVASGKVNRAALRTSFAAEDGKFEAGSAS